MSQLAADRRQQAAREKLLVIGYPLLEKAHLYITQIPRSSIRLLSVSNNK